MGDTCLIASNFDRRINFEIVIPWKIETATRLVSSLVALRLKHWVRNRWDEAHVNDIFHKKVAALRAGAFASATSFVIEETLTFVFQLFTRLVLVLICSLASIIQPPIVTIVENCKYTLRHVERMATRVRELFQARNCLGFCCFARWERYLYIYIYNIHVSLFSQLSFNFSSPSLISPNSYITCNDISQPGSIPNSPFDRSFFRPKTESS